MDEVEDLRRERDNAERLSEAYRVDRDTLLAALTNIAEWVLPDALLSDPQTEAERMILLARFTIATLPLQRKGLR